MSYYLALIYINITYYTISSTEKAAAECTRNCGISGFESSNSI